MVRNQHRTLVTLSAVPVGLTGVGALAIAVSSATSGFGNPIPWFIVALAVAAAAIGVARGERWAFVCEAIISATLLIGVTLATLFSIAMASATSGRLEGNMLGTPFGILSGWASLVLYGASFAAGVWMLAASNLGLRLVRP